MMTRTSVFGAPRRPLAPLLAPLLAGAVAACQPTVRVEAPDRPIEINLNVRIEQEVRVRVERDLEQVFREDPELFGLPGGGRKP
jgi:hypothetical protein